MHVGHGRWAALGDAIARVMRHAGYEVDEEFYINDQGNQMNVFADSLVVRYQQALGLEVEMPEDHMAEVMLRILLSKSLSEMEINGFR